MRISIPSIPSIIISHLLFLLLLRWMPLLQNWTIRTHQRIASWGTFQAPSGPEGCGNAYATLSWHSWKSGRRGVLYCDVCLWSLSLRSVILTRFRPGPEDMRTTRITETRCKCLKIQAPGLVLIIMFLESTQAKVRCYPPPTLKESHRVPHLSDSISHRRPRGNLAQWDDNDRANRSSNMDKRKRGSSCASLSLPWN